MRAARLYAAAIAAAVIVIAVPALAQFVGPVLPLSTTLVLQKPAPDQTFDDRQAIEIGFKKQTYRFILRDAYVDSPKLVWSDIWQSIRQFRPNLQILDNAGDELVELKPGEIVTVKGMYSMRTRVFIVSQVEPGGGAFAPERSY
ncbi:MAG: hypothetical protein ACHQZS_09310 [Candidatus Binatales bacterium]